MTYVIYIQKINNNDICHLYIIQITYHQKMATTRSYIMDATLVHANAVVLFGGEEVKK